MTCRLACRPAPTAAHCDERPEASRIRTAVRPPSNALPYRRRPLLMPNGPFASRAPQTASAPTAAASRALHTYLKVWTPVTTGYATENTRFRNFCNSAIGAFDT